MNATLERESASLPGSKINDLYGRLFSQLETKGLIQTTRRLYTLNDLFIKTKYRQVVKFQPNNIQRDYLDSIGYQDGVQLHGLREIDLKARQQGFSTLLQAIVFLDTINFDNTISVIIAHDLDTTIKLFRMMSLFFKRLPDDKPYTKTESQRELYWPGVNSRIYVETAGKPTAGRGDTINNLVPDEMGFWGETETLTGLLQGVPADGNIFANSTANGRGNQFHIEYQLATGRLEKDDEGRTSSVFRPHFYAWFQLDEYRLTPPEGFEKTPDEADYAALYNLADDQIYWRRRKLLEPGMGLARFCQEFPANDEEAFRSTGHLFFPDFLSEGKESHVTSALWLPVESDENGKDRRPPKWFRYGAGMDPGYADPWAFCLGGVDENTNLHAFESDEEAGLTDDEQAERIVQMFRRWGINPQQCPILAGADLWNVNTHNGVKLEPSVRRFQRRGLRMVPLANDGKSQFHRNSDIRDKMKIPGKIRIQAGFNSRLVECLSNAKTQIITVTTPDSRREAVVHDKWSHSVFAFGGLAAHWMGYKAADEPKDDDRPRYNVTEIDEMNGYAADLADTEDETSWMVMR